jgi:hypothetical protein
VYIDGNDGDPVAPGTVLYLVHKVQLIAVSSVSSWVIETLYREYIVSFPSYLSTYFPSGYSFLTVQKPAFLNQIWYFDAKKRQDLKSSFLLRKANFLGKSDSSQLYRIDKNNHSG